MKIRDLVDAIDGNVLCGGDLLEKEVEYAFASDLMSDVLTVQTDNMALLTGLTNLQAIRTAEMSDINCVIFVRNKKVSNEMVDLADEHGIALIECAYSMFKTCGLLMSKGLKPIY